MDHTFAVSVIRKDKSGTLTPSVSAFLFCFLTSKSRMNLNFKILSQKV